MQLSFWQRVQRKVFPPARFPAPEPDEPLCIIGDVHGCFDLLCKLLDKVPEGHRCVLVGDYIDRGDQSAEVLRFLSQRPELTCLMGNHEDMLLRFLEDPIREGERWIRNGGRETLATFQIEAEPQMGEAELIACRDRLQQALGPELIGWLTALPLSLQSGNVLVTHAGADPARAVDQQARKDLVWGHPQFRHQLRRDGVWVVHGHIIVPDPVAAQGRIAVDTGAYALGVLSAVCLNTSALRFLQVRP